MKEFVIGRFCQERSHLYHELHHYKMKMLRRVEEEIKLYRKEFGNRADANSEDVMQYLERKGRLRVWYNRFEGLLANTQRYCTEEKAMNKNYSTSNRGGRRRNSSTKRRGPNLRGLGRGRRY